MTRDELLTLISDKLETEGSARWTPTEVLESANRVFLDEWGNILDAAPYHRFAVVSVAPAADGTFPLTALDGGSGDAQRNFYRVLAMNDGSVLYTETRFQDVPLALVTGFMPFYSKLFYLAGDNYQTLPTGVSVLSVVVNHRPTALKDLSDGGVAFEFPSGCELVLVYETVAELLLKGGDDDAVARTNFRAQAELIRAGMLDELRRRTINPTRMAYPDNAADWGG